MHKAFAVHILNDTGKAKAGEIALVFDTALSELADIIADRTAEGRREWALVVTKLEEACFFAKKAMASDPANGAPAE